MTTLNQESGLALTVAPPLNVSLLQHALGLSERCRQPFRNHFLAGPGHADEADLQALLDARLMTCESAPAWAGGGDLYQATEAGRSMAIAMLPRPRKYSRYEQYLDSESGLSFPEWLGIEVPQRQYSADYFGPKRDHVRLVSSRGTGEYCKTLKEAKASYKAVLAERKRLARLWNTPEEDERGGAL